MERRVEFTKAFLSNNNVVQSVEVKLPNSLMICPTASLYLLEKLYTTPLNEGELFDFDILLKKFELS